MAGLQRLGVQRDAIEPDEADAQAVDAVDRRDDLVAERVDHRVVQAPVDRLRGVEQRRRHAARGALDDVAVRGLERVELCVGRGQRELRGRFPLQRQAELERVAHELHVDVGDLQAALRHRDEQAFGFQARNHFADRAERQARERRELALRHELPGTDPRGQELLLEAVVRLPAQLARRRVARRRTRASRSIARAPGFGSHVDSGGHSVIIASTTSSGDQERQRSARATPLERDVRDLGA